MKKIILSTVFIATVFLSMTAQLKIAQAAVERSVSAQLIEQKT